MMLIQALKLIGRNASLIRGEYARAVLLPEQLSPQFPLHAGRKFSGPMSGYAFRVSCNGTVPKIMSTTVSNQATPGRFQFLYELFRFHNFKELVNNNTKINNNIALCKCIVIFLCSTINI